MRVLESVKKVRGVSEAPPFDFRTGAQELAGFILSRGLSSSMEQGACFGALPSAVMQCSLAPFLDVCSLCALERVSTAAHALLVLDRTAHQRLWHAFAAPYLWAVRRRRTGCRRGTTGVAEREDWKALCRRLEVSGAWIAVLGGSDGADAK